MVKITPEFVLAWTSETKKKVNNHVLEDFKEDEEDKINEITENIVKQLPTLIEKSDLFQAKLIKT